MATSVLLLGLLFVSPLDAVVFGDGGGWPGIRIIVGRNLGVLLCTTAISCLTHKYLLACIVLGSTGIALLFIKQLLPLLDKKVTHPISVVPDINPVFKSPGDTTTASEVAVEGLKATYLALSAMPAQQRGYAFQDFLDKLFTAYQLSSKRAFRNTGEELDGSFELDTHIYLVEAKWQAEPISQKDLLIFNGKVESKSAWTRGLFISYSGYSKDGLSAFARGRRTAIIGMDGNDIALILDGHISLTEAIRKKLRRSSETNDFFVPLAELIR
jgi:hypothetical protein